MCEESGKVAAMHKDAREFLERAAECARLAEGVVHPEPKLYLTEHGPRYGALRCEGSLSSRLFSRAHNPRARSNARRYGAPDNSGRSENGLGMTSVRRFVEHQKRERTTNPNI
jgi:hypothetical protein